MISVDDWAEIRRLHRAEGLPIKAIVRNMGSSRNTVRAALRSDGPPKYERAPAGSVADGSSRGSGSCCGVPDDAGDGDRGADRLGAVDPDAAERVRGTAAGVPAAGSGVADVVWAGELAQDDFWFPASRSRSGPGRSARRSSCRC